MLSLLWKSFWIELARERERERVNSNICNRCKNIDIVVICRRRKRSIFSSSLWSSSSRDNYVVEKQKEIRCRNWIGNGHAQLLLLVIIVWIVSSYCFKCFHFQINYCLCFGKKPTLLEKGRTKGGLGEAEKDNILSRIIFNSWILVWVCECVLACEWMWWWWFQ